MRRYTIATILVSLALMAAGCGKPSKPSTTAPSGSAPQPPAIELRTAKPIDIPATAIPEGDKVPIYLRVRDPRQAVERIGEWTSATTPTLTPQAISQNIEASGVPLSKFTPGKNALAVIWPVPNEKIAGGILPVEPGTDLSQLGLQTEPIAGGGVLFGADTEGKGLKQAQSIKDDLLKMQQAEMSSDIELSVDVKSQWAIYGPMVRMMLPGALSNIASMSQAGGQPMPTGIQGILTAYATAFMDLLDQTKNVTVRANFDKEAIDLSFVLEGRGQDGGTTLTAALSNEPVSSPELTRFVSKSLMVGQMTYRDIGKMTETMIGYMAMMTPDKPDAAAELRSQFAGIEKIGAMHIGMGMSMAPDSPAHVEYVMVPDNTEALIDLVRTKIGMVNSGPLHEFYKKMDMDIRVTTQPLKREYKGYTVEAYKMSFTAGPNAGEIDRQMMARMFPGEVPLEYAQVGKYVVASAGKAVDSLIDRLLAPEGGAPAGSVQSFPAGGIFYLDYDIIGYLRAARESMPNAPQMNLPENAPSLQLAGYHQQGKAYYIVRIPRGMVTALGKMNEPEATPATTPAS